MAVTIIFILLYFLLGHITWLFLYYSSSYVISKMGANYWTYPKWLASTENFPGGGVHTIPGFTTGCLYWGLGGLLPGQGATRVTQAYLIHQCFQRASWAHNLLEMAPGVSHRHDGSTNLEACLSWLRSYQSSVAPNHSNVLPWLLLAKSAQYTHCLRQLGQ